MLLLHDMSKDDFQNISNVFPKDTTIISKELSDIHPCCGCFACWLKTPGKCVIKDDYTLMPKYIAENNTFVVICEIKYGSYTSYIKNVIERSIGFLLPFIKNINNECHHSIRYKDRIPKLIFIGYSNCIAQEEKETFSKLVKGNAINFGAGDKYECHIVDNLTKINDLINIISANE